LSQALDPGAYQPWGLGEVDSAPDTDSQQWDVALLDDYQYGLAMFQNYGWSTFKVNFGATGWPTGFTNVARYRRTYLPALSALYARLFRGGDGNVYAVASELDRSTDTVRVAQFTDGVVGTATVPVTGLNSSDPLETASIAGKWWLFALHRGAGASVLIYDLSGVTASALTNPLFSVQSVVSVPGGADFYVDKGTRRLLVLVSGNPYTISCTLGTLAAGNYSFTFTTGALTITKAVLTVDADDTSREYGESNPPFTATISGFKNLATSGITKTMPTMIACQTRQVSPLYHSVKRLDYKPPKKVTSIADALVSTNPPLLNLMIKELQEAKGDAEIVDENEIEKAFTELAHKGFFVEPSSAVAYSAYRKQLRDKKIPKEDKAVVILTGHGLKTTPQKAP